MSQIEVLGRFLHERRRIMELTLRVIADVAYVSNTQVSLWEHGRAIPTDYQLTRVAGVLGVSVTELLDRKYGRTNEFERATRDDPNLSLELKRAIMAMYGDSTGRRSIEIIRDTGTRENAAA